MVVSDQCGLDALFLQLDVDEGSRAVTSTTPWSIHAALLVARGKLDLAVQTRGHVWDYAATSLIVEEAGGRFSGLDGQARPTPGPALFARSAALHTAALQILNTDAERIATTVDQSAN